MVKLQKNNWGPRIGLAYAFTPKTVLRAGFGTFFQRPGVADNVFLGGQAPFQPFVSVANGNVDNPGGTQGVGFPFYFMTQDPVFKIPRSHQWNVTFERELPFSTDPDGRLISAAWARIWNAFATSTSFNRAPSRPTRASTSTRCGPTRALRRLTPMRTRRAPSTTPSSWRPTAGSRKGCLLGFAYTYSKSLRQCL